MEGGGVKNIILLLSTKNEKHCPVSRMNIGLQSMLFNEELK
jgi:hypothetical protein